MRFTRENGRPIELGLALELLPLVVVRDLDSYDEWACRWLARWLRETRGARKARVAPQYGSSSESNDPQNEHSTSVVWLRTNQNGGQ